MMMNEIKIPAFIMRHAQVGAARCVNEIGCLVDPRSHNGLTLLWHRHNGSAEEEPVRLDALAVADILKYRNDAMDIANDTHAQACYYKRKARSDGLKVVGYGTLSMAFGAYVAEKVPTISELDTVLHSEVKVDNGVLGAGVVAALLAVAAAEKVAAVFTWFYRMEENFIDSALACGNVKACDRAIAQARAPRQE